MALLEQIQKNLRQLPPEKQSEVLDFVIFLQQRPGYHQARPTADRQQTLKKSLEQLAALGIFANLPDPSTWQRQIRQDRPLPGREA